MFVRNDCKVPPARHRLRAPGRSRPLPAPARPVPAGPRGARCRRPRLTRGAHSPSPCPGPRSAPTAGPCVRAGAQRAQLLRARCWELRLGVSLRAGVSNPGHPWVRSNSWLFGESVKFMSYWYWNIRTWSAAVIWQLLSATVGGWNTCFRFLVRNNTLRSATQNRHPLLVSLWQHRGAAVPGPAGAARARHGSAPAWHVPTRVLWSFPSLCRAPCRCAAAGAPAGSEAGTDRGHREGSCVSHSGSPRHRPCAHRGQRGRVCQNISCEQIIYEKASDRLGLSWGGKTW